MQISCQRPAATQFFQPGWILPDKNLLCFCRDDKISGKFFCGILGTDAEQSCGEVDDISAGPAAEAEEVILMRKRIPGQQKMRCPGILLVSNMIMEFCTMVS